MGQRSGRFTFKSGRGNSEIYLHQGEVRHAAYGTLEGEGASVGDRAVFISKKVSSVRSNR
jgi:hypothetical protein